MSLTQQNIESELSYAYLHAVAAKAGISCKPGDRHDDGQGVDAELNFRGETTHRWVTHVQLNVQLKATIKPPTNVNECLSYFIQGKERYEKLRTKDSAICKLLIVLFLPKDCQDWLSCDAEQLVLKKAAYWVNLYQAGPCSNATGETVYLPISNLVTPDELLRVVDLAVHDRVPPYTKRST